MEILDRFGIDGKLLLVQLINFAILVAVVWRFVLPRITKLLDERKRTIEDQLKAAETARKEAEQAEAEREKARRQTEEEIAAMLKEAKDTAARTRTELLNAAKRDADAARARAEEQIAADRAKLREELRAETATLVIETTRKVLSDVVRPSDRKRLVADAADHIRKQARGGPRAR